MAKDGKKMRIAATADVHYGKHSKGKMQELFTTVSREADVLADLRRPDRLRPAGGSRAARGRHSLVCAHPGRSRVLGNHDFESAQPEAVAKVMEEAGVEMLDGESVEIDGVGFAGVCGFGGGFGRRMLNAWGEPLIKTFVQEAIDQALRLEQALTKLTTERRIVLLHYAPDARHGRRRAAGDLSVSRLDATGGADQSLPRQRLFSRPRAQRNRGRRDARRTCRSSMSPRRCLQKDAPDKQPFRLFEI